jgi:hypothetical protein
MTMHDFETIDPTTLGTITGGNIFGDLWDATTGAIQYVTSPITSIANGVGETVGALRQGHGFTDSVMSGFVQGAGMNAPRLSQIPVRR